MFSIEPSVKFSSQPAAVSLLKQQKNTTTQDSEASWLMRQNVDFILGYRVYREAREGRINSEWNWPLEQQLELPLPTLWRGSSLWCQTGSSKYWLWKKPLNTGRKQLFLWSHLHFLHTFERQIHCVVWNDPKGLVLSRLNIEIGVKKKQLLRWEKNLQIWCLNMTIYAVLLPFPIKNTF